FVAADVRTLNLETVVSDRPSDAAYPGKRFILRSRPEALRGVLALEATVASLANNHARDFLDVGIGDTLAALAHEKVPALGAAVDDAPQAPFVTDVRGARIGMLSFTSVDGTSVNEAYPQDGTPIPDDADKGDFK